MITDPTKIAFSGRYNFLKIVKDETAPILIPATGVYADYLLTNHNLGYIPRARVWYEPNAGEIWPLSNQSYQNIGGGSGTAPTVLGSMYLTSTGLYVRMVNSSGVDKTVTFRWRVYADE